jgi:hypothetical protein
MILSHGLVVRVLLFLETKMLCIRYTLDDKKNHKHSRNPEQNDRIIVIESDLFIYSLFQSINT